MELYFYDIEISPNMFMVTFIPNISNNIVKAYINADIEEDDVSKGIILEKGIKPITFTIAKFQDGIINDYPLLYDFLNVHKVYIGYNNNNYDNLILDYLIYFYDRFNKNLKHKHTNEDLNFILFKISDTIVSYGKGYNRIFYNEHKILRYFKPYTAYDIQKILYLDKSFTSLKQVGIQLKWYRIQDLPYKFNELTNRDSLPLIRDYNINDCLITRELFNNQINEVKLRNDISEQYEINLRNQSRSGMANMLAAKFYEEKSGIGRKDFIDLRTFRTIIKFGDIISPKISFKTEKLKQLLIELKNYNHRVGGNSFNKEILFNGTLYTFATGGLHSNDPPGMLKSNNLKQLIDADVKELAS